MRSLAFAAIFCFIFVAAFIATFVAKADDLPWNQFRGPRGDGTSTSTNLPVTFGEGSPEIVWKTPLPGRAWSSPVIWGDQVWLTNGPEVQNVTPEIAADDHIAEAERN